LKCDYFQKIIYEQILNTLAVHSIVNNLRHKLIPSFVRLRLESTINASKNRWVLTDCRTGTISKARAKAD
jgi:hypothetical protein